MAKFNVLNFMTNVDRESWVHHLDPRTKVALLFFFSIIPLIFTDPRFLVGFILLTLPLWLGGNIDFRSMLGPLLGVGFFLVITVLLVAVKGPQELTTPDPYAAYTWYVRLGPLVVTSHTLLHAFFKCLRLAVPLTFGLLIIATTDPTALGKGLRKLRLPIEVVFMALAGLRFIPIMTEQTFNILDAMTIRGVSTSRVERTKLLLLPLLITSLRRTRTMGLACEARGFGARRWNTYYQDFRFSKTDKAVLIGILVLTIALFIARYVFHLGFLNVGFQK